MKLWRLRSGSTYSLCLVSIRIHGVPTMAPPPLRSTTCRLWTIILRGRPVHVVIFQQQYTLVDWRLLIWKSHIRSPVVVTSHWPSCTRGNKTLANIILLLEVYSFSRFGFLRNKATMQRSQRDNCRPFIEPGTAGRISVVTEICFFFISRHVAVAAILTSQTFVSRLKPYYFTYLS